jgi:thymidylate synthase ThyX
VGIFATGQAYEQMLLRLLSTPLPEAQAIGTMILEELQKVMPSFVARVDRPDRGGEWMSYLSTRRDQATSWARRLGLDRRDRGDAGPSVRLLSVRGSEDELLASLLFEAASVSEAEARDAVRVLPPDERAQLLSDLVGERSNRRHRPGRGFEAISYRFEVVSDYGAFRDLQRHRLLTVQWQTLGPDLGAGIPAELRDAGVADDYERGLERSAGEYERIRDAGLAELAPYALCLGYRIRYILDMNAREAMHLIELRSGREGHPGYRAVAHELHAQIAEVHPTIAAAMTFVDDETEPRLERILSEIRTQAKLTASGRA